MKKWIKIDWENSDDFTNFEIELFKLNNHRVFFMFFMNMEKNDQNRWFEFGIDFFEWAFNIGVNVGQFTLNIGINNIDPISLNDERLGE